jgi:hypothetical protein
MGVVVLTAAAWVLISEAGRSCLICRGTDLRHRESRDPSLNPSEPRDAGLLAISTTERCVSLPLSLGMAALVHQQRLIHVG